MPNLEKKNNGGLPDNKSLDSDTIKEFIKIQAIQAQNESKEIEIKAKESELNYKYALKSLELQNDYLRNRPEEGRKTLKTIGNYLIIVVLILFVFSGFCIYIGEKDFLLEFLKIIGYFVTTAFGYFLGKKNSNSKNNSPDSEIRED